MIEYIYFSLVKDLISINASNDLGLNDFEFIKKHSEKTSFRLIHINDTKKLKELGDAFEAIEYNTTQGSQGAIKAQEMFKGATDNIKGKVIESEKVAKEAFKETQDAIKRKLKGFFNR